MRFLQPRACTKHEMDSPEFYGVAGLLGLHLCYHRKVWEHVVIAQCFLSRRHGSALGLAVGRERLPAFFAQHDCLVLATDAPEGGEWAATDQHATCSSDPKVPFRAVDMRAIPHDLYGRFEFVWSSCALEHLGSLKAGHDFVLESVRCLRPGGLAVHTTEFNVSSNTSTLTSGESVLYRRQDIERMIDDLRAGGSMVEEPSFYLGDDPMDWDVDEGPNYRQEPHLKLRLGGFVTTSYVIVARRGLKA